MWSLLNTILKFHDWSDCVWSMTKMRHDNDISDHIGPLYAGKKYNCYDQSDKILFMMKFRQDNDVTDCIGMVYAEIETELSWPIKQDAVYHEKQTRQRHDQSYKFDLHIIQYYNIMTNPIVCSLWWKLDGWQSDLFV